MTKNDLNEYFWLNHEIKRQKNRLKRLEEKLQHSGEVVGDSVQKYYNGKAHPYKIEGIAETDIQLPLMIVTLKAEIETNIDKAEKKAVEIEQFIQGCLLYTSGIRIWKAGDKIKTKRTAKVEQTREA